MWIGGDSGQLWRSADNGRSWQRYHTEIGSAIQKILWSNEQDGLVATYNGIYVTHDQGETWANVTPPQSVQAILRPLESINMHAFDVSQEGDVWLVGTRGSVLHGELGGDSWQIYRSEWEDAQKYANQKISLGWSRFALGVGLGYVHPTGRIADRYGPGAMINFDFWFRLGRTKIGVGGIAMLLSQKENIVALPGHLHATEARPLEMLGTMVHLPVIFQVPVFEYGHFGVHAQVGAGFVYHQFWLSDDDVEKLPDNVNYTRERVGVGMLQAIVFGWYVAMPDFTVTPTATGRLGLRLRIGLQESRTWPDGGPQIDLGRKDDANLGFELWPFSTLEFIIGFL